MKARAHVVRGFGMLRTRRSGRGTARALAAGICVLAICAGVAPPASAVTRVWAVGDGAVPERTDDDLAARIARERIYRLLYLGDVYESGTAREYRDYYDPSWGRFKAITYPTPGNHEWGNRAVGYDPYWGRRAPRSGGGHYYSFNLDGWHFVSLNSHEDSGPGSAQAAWLSRDLERYRGTCTIAFHHRPRYSAGGHGDASDLEPLYARLAGRAVALLGGHEHNYQRLRPQRGITQFVVGTGGRKLSDLDSSDRRLAAFDDSHHGALGLVLRRRRLDFRFVRTGGGSIDAGSLPCRPHGGSQPRVRVLRPRSGQVLDGLRTVRGRARAVRGAVRLRIVRTRGRRCRGFDGERFRRVACGRAKWVRASGGRRWRLRLPRRLAPGSYRVTARVTGALKRRATHSVRFEVR